MKYLNAKIILPDYLVEELQKYIQGGYLYVPSKQGQRKSWGELSGFRKEIENRNAKIRRDFNAGCSIEALADTYFLSVYSIKKIIYEK